MSVPVRNVLVCGGRTFDDRARVHWALAGALKGLAARGEALCLVHGGATGADALAGEWAALHGVPCAVFPAPWASHLGKRAGIVRNGWMLGIMRPILVLHFPGGTGTAHMVSAAKAAGVPTHAG